MMPKLPDSIRVKRKRNINEQQTLLAERLGVNPSHSVRDVNR